jgi:hypothetical protein
MEVVRALALKVPIFQLPIVTVPAAPALSNIAVSCARGKLLTSGLPPDVSAHPVADQFCVPARFQYTVLGAGKLMPLLPPQFPTRVGDDPAAAPAIVMSLKSQSLIDRFATFSVLVNPIVADPPEDLKNILLTGVAPDTVRVPVTV